MIKFPLALLAALLMTGASLRGEDSSTGFRVTEGKIANGVTLNAESTYDTEFTITVNCQLTNATSSQPVPLTVDSAGRQTFELVRIQQKNPALAWNYKFTYHWIPGARRGVNTNDAVYALPFRAGEAHRVIQGNLGKFSHYQGSQDEYAVDFDAPVGTTVCAARAGVVTGVRQDFTVGGADLALKSAANYVTIKHADGTFAQYLHLQTNGALVRLGEKVAEGQPIARSGNTGYTKGPHLHFIVFQTIDGEKRLALPTKFRTRLGVVTTLQEGQSY